MVVATQKITGRRNLWFERLMAIAAVVNLGLVLFDLSYIKGRGLYLRYLPSLTQVYDPIKGIEPHRETQQYLNTVNALKEQVSQTGLRSLNTENLLEKLRRLSVEMIENNPFEVASKTGTLEKIKNRMRDRVGKESSREAFGTFWSQAYLSTYGWQREISFFNRQIQPLIQTNYYRHVGENGEFIDYFWLIDLPFIILFSVEFLARTWTLRRRHASFSWIDAIMWRWYDVFLLLPFWRWLRVISVLVRLDQAKLLNLHPVRQQIHRGVVANFAEELTEIVVVRVINQIQDSIRSGEVTRWLFQSDKRRSYIDINNINEMEAIASMMVQLVVYQVLPKIQPDIVAILRHNIESVISQSPMYRGVQNLPGLGNLPTELSDHLAIQVTQSVYNALVAAVEDPVGAKLSSQLVEHFSAALGSEMQKKHTLGEIQALLIDMLEEVKLNYVQRLAQEDVEQIIEETKQARLAAFANKPGGKDSVLPSRKVTDAINWK